VWIPMFNLPQNLRDVIHGSWLPFIEAKSHDCYTCNEDLPRSFISSSRSPLAPDKSQKNRRGRTP